MVNISSSRWSNLPPLLQSSLSSLNRSLRSTLSSSGCKPPSLLPLWVTPPLCLSAVGSSRCRGWNRSGQTGEREDVWIDRLIDEQKDEVGLKLRDAEY